MSFCSKCGQSIEENINYCPNCGNNFNETKTAIMNNSMIENKKVGFFGFLANIIKFFASCFSSLLKACATLLTLAIIVGVIYGAYAVFFRLPNNKYYVTDIKVNGISIDNMSTAEQIIYKTLFVGKDTFTIEVKEETMKFNISIVSIATQEFKKEWGQIKLDNLPRNDFISMHSYYNFIFLKVTFLNQTVEIVFYPK